MLASSQGAAWTYNGFSTVWHRFKTGLEQEGLIAPGLTLKGLRHTVATTLREAGLDERRIADLLGQKNTVDGAALFAVREPCRQEPRDHGDAGKKRTQGGRRLSNLPAKSVKPDPEKDQT